MRKICTICDYEIKDGDSVVAIMVAEFKAIDSDVNFAISHPSKCVEVVHNGCFDWQDYEDEERNGD